MKSLRYAALILLLLTTIILQSCGNGGAGKETNGSLTMSTLAVTGPTSGVYTISETITYTPPAGKVPNALEVDVILSKDDGVNPPVSTTVREFLDSTGSFTLTDFAVQGSNGVFYSATAKTGDLLASRGTLLAGFTPLNATPSPIVFASTDLAGTVKTSTIAGGLSPYAVTSTNVPSGSTGVASDISATIAGGTLSVTKTSLTGATQKSLLITITDANGATLPIQVLYFGTP